MSNDDSFYVCLFKNPERLGAYLGHAAGPENDFRETFEENKA